MARSRRDRRRGREAALQVLYQWEVGRADLEVAIDTFFDLQWDGAEPPSDEVRLFASELTRDTVSRLASIDALVAETAERWRPERMALIDRLILRLAICELLREAPTPPAVVINEALELARTFSTEDAVKFINGMLDGVRKKLESRVPGSGREPGGGARAEE